MASVFTCTACAVSFSDSDAHKLHYKLDWHRYNLRRKVADLGPVDQDDFDRRLAAALGSDAPKADFHGRCKECRKSFRSEGLYKQHLQSKKHKEATKVRAAPRAATVAPDAADLSSPSSPSSGPSVPSASATDDSGGGAPAGAAAPSAVAAAGAASVSDGVIEDGAAAMSSAPSGPLKGGVAAQPEAKEDEMEEEEEEEEEGEGEEELAPPRMGLGVCIFCNVEAVNFQENCQHMLHQHGFFIPDVEYLVDPEGLVGYVEEKVKLGNICIYCNGKGKTFHTYRSLQQHMTDRAHCKLLYDEDEDLHEYETFYDFSSSYSDAEKRGVVADSDAGDATDETNEPGEESDDVEVTRTLAVTDLGELVLLDGRTLGNRKWSRYYKQRLRTPDEREAVVAQRRATRLQLGAMYDDEMRKGTSTGNAVALQRGERRAFGGLSGVSRPKDVKMLRAHQRSQARQRLKTELRQNKLNKTFDRVAEM